MRIWLWHVHGSWMTAFVQGGHEYFVPVNDARDADGRGRARTWEWPANVHEVTQDEAQDLAVDAVVLQRPSELHELVPEWLGRRRAGVDVPAIYLEHNTPPGPVCGMAHPAADRADLVIAHVTHCNALFWDTGTTRTRIVRHGIIDPGYRYTGEVAHSSAVINEAARRGRATGTDLLERFREAGPVDLFGLDAGRLGGFEELDQSQLHVELARRRLLVHPNRWTSLSLSLLEAMHLGVPIVAVGTTEVWETIPPGCGVVSLDMDALVRETRTLLHEPERAREVGRKGRAAVLDRHGLARFLDEWNVLLEEVAA